MTIHRNAPPVGRKDLTVMLVTGLPQLFTKSREQAGTKELWMWHNDEGKLCAAW